MADRARTLPDEIVARGPDQARAVSDEMDAWTPGRARALPEELFAGMSDEARALSDETLPGEVRLSKNSLGQHLCMEVILSKSNPGQYVSARMQSATSTCYNTILDRASHLVRWSNCALPWLDGHAPCTPHCLSCPTLGLSRCRSRAAPSPTTAA